MNPQINPQPARYRAPRVGLGAAVAFMCGSKFTMQLSGSGPNAASPPALPAGFVITNAVNQGTLNGATVWALEGTYNGPSTSPTSFDNIYYGTNYPWSIVTATVTPPFVPMVWDGTACVTAPAGHTPCPPGTYWNGNSNACIHQVVFGAPTPGSPPPFQVSMPVHTPTASTGGTNTGGAGAAATSTSSSSTKYYIAGAGVAALAAVAAYYEWGRKAVRR